MKNIKSKRAARFVTVATCVLLVVLSGIPVVSADESRALNTSNTIYDYWPSTSTIPNQKVGNYAKDSIADVEVAANLWDIVLNRENGTINDVGIGLVASANARNTLKYSTSSVKDSTFFRIMWQDAQVNNWAKLTLPDNGGSWVSISNYDRGLWYYGAFYNMIWVCSNGFVVLDSTDYYASRDTSQWATATPTLSSKVAPNPVIAPLWRDLDPTADTNRDGKPDGEIRCGYFQQSFVIAWRVPNKKDLKMQEFALEILGTHWAHTPLNEIRFDYGTISSLSGTVCGMEDGLTLRSTPVTPTTNYRRMMVGTTESGQVIKSFKITVTQYRNVIADYVNPDLSWSAGDSNSYVYFTGAGQMAPGLINMVLQNPADGSYPVTTWLGGASYLMGLVGLVPGLELVGVAGMLLDAGLLIYELSQGPTAPSNPYHLWDALHAGPSPEIYMQAKDEASGNWFAYDVTLAPYIHWMIKKADTACAHRLKIDVTAYYQSWDGYGAVTPLTTTTDIKIGPDFNFYRENPSGVGWYARTIPEGHTYEFRTFDQYDVAVSPPGMPCYMINSDYSDNGYEICGWSRLTSNLAEDYMVRDDGSIRVEGWFKHQDNLGTLGATERFAFVRVYYSDADGDNTPDGNFQTVAGSRLLFGPDEPMNQWRFKSILIDGLTPGKRVKIAFARGDPVGGGTSVQVNLYWAGIVVYGKVVTTEGGQTVSKNYYAEYVSATAGGSTTPAARANAYSVEYGVQVTVTAVPNTAAGYRFDYWMLDGVRQSTTSTSLTAIMTKDRFFEAHFVYGTSPTRYLTVSSSDLSKGTTKPAPGVYPYADGTYSATFVPWENYPYIWSYWLVDGVKDYTNHDISLYMNQDHTLVCYYKSAGCVAEGTMVTMADGSERPVEKIKVGDCVLGYSLSDGSFVSEEVLATHSTKVDTIYNINDGALRVTPSDQPIYCRYGAFTGWIQDPRDIAVCSEIYVPSTGEWVLVTSITVEDGKFWVYDFTTTGPKTYLANSYLVMDKPIP